MKNSIFIFLFTLSSFQLLSQVENTFFETADSFFKAHVYDGKVDYKAIHSNPLQLNELMDMAEILLVLKKDKQTYQAFWINAYNLSVIKGIIDNYPTKSPLDIKGFFDKTKYKLAGKSVTLNDIENSILRAEFNDPRFHFVLVCGAVGCPPLINEAYVPNTLDSKLTNQTKSALNDDEFIMINTKEKIIRISEILKWYKEDFTMNDTSEIDFINAYRSVKVPSDYKLTYFKYNWNLNAK